MARIASIIRAQLKQPEAAIDASTTARELSGWDSLAHTGIILAVERAFQIRFRSTEMIRFDSVGALVDVVIARGKL